MTIAAASKRVLFGVAVATVLLAGCVRVPIRDATVASPDLPIIDLPSANQDERVRFLVLHYTDGDFERARYLLTQPTGRPVSSHYLVTRAGDAQHPRPVALRLVDESRRAWHAGVSQWQGREQINDTSIGIEIVYGPDCPASGNDADCDYPDYPADQIALVRDLCADILRRHPDIDPSRVVGHADIQPDRKPDPGPRFPWRELAAAGVGAWPADADVARQRARLDGRPADLALLHEALVAYGYGIRDIGAADAHSHAVLWAFQTHFRPAGRSGEFDLDTLATALALVERYRPEQWKGLVAGHAWLGQG